MVDAWVKKIGQKRGIPYLYFDGEQAVRTGFAPGQKYEVIIEDNKVILSANVDGSKTISKKVKGDKSYPVIDIQSKELLKIFDGMSAIRVVVQNDKVYLLPLASEIKKRERITRITDNLNHGVPLKMGSLFHGGGILSHAIHEGLKNSGFDVDLEFANEIREDLLQHAAIANDAWSENTAALAMPTQELAQDDWLLSRLPKLDILEAGVPCNAASVAGVAKRGLSKMEDAPDVGHLVFSTLLILNKTQPSVVLFENVVNYSQSSSAMILRHQLRDMGYSTQEAILSGKDFGCLENRIRWCMVATTEGLDFSFENLAPNITIVKKLGDYLDQSITEDDPRYRAVEYLKTKERRDAEKGNSFSMQFVTPDSTSVPTLRKGYHKGGSPDPRLISSKDQNLSRLLTAAEHARIKGVPDHLISGLSETVGHQLLGQGVAYSPFEAVGRRIGESLSKLAEKVNSNTKSSFTAKSVNAAARALIGDSGLAALKHVAESGQLDLCDELENDCAGLHR
jgi:DNA (cytosine-5)-methyltransferase 1